MLGLVLAPEGTRTPIFVAINAQRAVEYMYIWAQYIIIKLEVPVPVKFVFLMRLFHSIGSGQNVSLPCFRSGASC